MRRTSIALLAISLGSAAGLACHNQSGVRTDGGAGQVAASGGSGGGGAGGTTGGQAGIGGGAGGTTGGQAGTGGSEVGGSTSSGGSTGGSSSTPDAAADSAAGGPDSSEDAADDAFAGGACVANDDCIAVLDYRTGFECWAPSAASKTDVSRDPCLVPWKPNPRCTTPSPPAECPAGDRPVTHSCFATSCVVPTCINGRCSVVVGIGCDKLDGGPAQPDCEALRTTYLIALAAAQQCYPSLTSSACQGVWTDECGCDMPYESSGICATALSEAFDQWRNSGCANFYCARTCAARNPAVATCAASESGATGTCGWQ